eukprot:COSAG03_NODE_7848_length_866_cov_0.698827_2_plen_90_part_00
MVFERTRSGLSATTSGDERLGEQRHTRAIGLHAIGLHAIGLQASHASTPLVSTEMSWPSGAVTASNDIALHSHTRISETTLGRGDLRPI